MNKELGATIVAVVGLVATIGVVVGAKVLQDPRRAVYEEASSKVEEARRLVDQYSTGFDRTSLLLDELGARGVDVQIDDATALMESSEDAFRDEYEAKLETFFPDARASGGSSSQLAREGVQKQRELLSRNAKLLTEAMGHIDDALAISSGGADARNHIEGNRLKGVVLYLQGVAQQLEIAALRRDAVPLREELLSLAESADALTELTSMVGPSGIEEEIAKLQSEAKALEAQTRTEQTELDELTTQIDALNSRLTDAEQRAADSRARIETLTRTGPDLTSPTGVEDYARQYDEASTDYRKAQADIIALKTGTYPDAALGGMGDPLSDPYRSKDGSGSPTIAFGISHYTDARTAVEARLAGLKDGLGAMNANIAALQEQKQHLAEREQRAAEALAQAKQETTARLTALKDVMAATREAEDKALALLEKASRSAVTAQAAAAAWISESGTRAGQVSPARKEASAFENASKAVWMDGFLEAQITDADLIRGFILADRYRDALINAFTYTTVNTALGIESTDATEQESLAEAAKAEGTELVTGIMRRLRSAHRNTNRHWTIAAEAAGATYLLALLGDPSYINDARLQYENVVKGNEDKAFLAPYLARYRELQGR